MLVHCFVDVSYTTVLTGFSTQLVVLLSEKGSLTAGDIKTIYGTTGKEDPVTEVRLNHLIKSRYITAEQDGYRILPKGRLVGKMTKLLQRLFNTDMGG